MDVAICEFVDNRGSILEVDAAAGVVKNVKLLGVTSANGRVYSEGAMHAAKQLYEAAPVFLNHKQKPGDVRSVTERFGEPYGVTVKPGQGLFAETFKFNPKHPFAEQFVWDAQNAPHRLGFSHDIVGRTTVKDGKTIVESISKVNSIDLVAQPATTRGLYEQVEPEGANAVEITLEAVKAKPEIVAAILKEHQNSEAEKAKDAEIKTLREQVDRHETAAKLAAKKAAVAKAIEEAKLPKELVSDVFVGLCEAADEAGLKALIEDRQALVKGLPASKAPQSKEQGVTEGVGGAVAADPKAAAKRWTS